VFVLLVGPFVFIWETLTESIGAYLYQFVPMSFRSGAFGGSEWLSSWTIFYWAWWISWTPFVGTFLARISKGRTIREYLLGVLLVPTGVTFVWFAIFGGTAIDLQLTGKANLIDAAAKPEVSLFSLLEQLPLTTITSALVIFLVALFFISGADAASVVMGMMSSRGNLEPSRGVVVVWGTLTGLAAIVLLLAGGLTALQQAAIIAAAPFVFIIVGMVVGMLKEMRREPIQATVVPVARAPVAAQPGFAPQPPTALGPESPTG
jgi:glycine betaine transporter